LSEKVVARAVFAFKMKLFSRLAIFLFIAFPLIITISNKDIYARAEDAVEEEITADEDEAMVETGTEGEEETPEDATKTQGSPDIDLAILFTTPEGNGMDLPAGKPVEFLVGITNNGNKDYIVDAADVAFKYPMDFTYTIQNFTAAVYNKQVKPKQEATVFYNFFTAEQFAGRSLGLQINLLYHDAEGEDFVEAVFNSTVNIIELDEGFDTETFFLYVFLLAFVVLILFGVHQLLTSMGVQITKKSSGSSKKSYHQSSVEVGTAKNGVDYDWLPEQMKADLKKQAAEKAAVKNGSAGKKSSSPPARSAPSAAVVKSGVQPTRSSPRLRKT